MLLNNQSYYFKPEVQLVCPWIPEIAVVYNICNFMFVTLRELLTIAMYVSSTKIAWL